MKITRFFLMSVCLLLICGCTKGGDKSDDKPSTDACKIIGLSPRIINGTVCDSTSSPVVMVILELQDGSVGFCSGSVIGSQDVLTAAHCFSLEPVRSVYLNLPTGTVNAANYRVHPQAVINETTGESRYDFAIVHFNQPLGLPTLPLLESPSVKTGDIISIYGFGKGSSNDPLVTAPLRSGQMKVATSDALTFTAIYDGVGSDTCNGDSGGPVVMKVKTANSGTVAGIVGVTSAGLDSNCGIGDTAIFANGQSSSVLNFIKGSVADVQID